MAGKAARARKRLTAGNFALPSPAEIEEAMTPAGGWTAAQLAEWGVPYPPLKGWRKRLEDQWQERWINGQYGTRAREAEKLAKSTRESRPFPAENPSGLIQRKAQRILVERGAHAQRLFLEHEADKLLRCKPNTKSRTATIIISGQTEEAAREPKRNSRSASDRRPCVTCGTRREMVWLTDRKIGGEVLRELSFCGPDCLRDWELANGCLDTPWAPEPNSKRVEPPPDGCAQCGKNRKMILITDGANPDGTLRVFAFCGERCRDAWKAENPFGTL
jgi:hypothetical protein